MLTIGPVLADGCAVQHLLDGHAHHCRRRNLSPATIEQRSSILARLDRQLGTIRLIDATTEQIALVLDARALGPKARYGWISHTHMFFAWCIREGHATFDPTLGLDRPRLPAYLPRPISDADLTLALAGADGRMRCWLTLAAYGGLRVSEIASLDGCDVLIADGLLRIFGKGRKERIIPMHERIAVELRRAAMPRSGPIFLSVHGTPFDAARVSNLMAEHLRACGIDATAHQLRHWFGSRTYAATGGDLLVTQNLMGHSSPTTTAVYAAWSQKKGREAVDAL